MNDIALDSADNMQRAWDTIRIAPSGTRLRVKILRAGTIGELEVER